MRCTRAKQSNDAWSERRMQDAVECICSTQLRSDDDELRVYTQYSTVQYTVYCTVLYSPVQRLHI